MERVMTLLERVYQAQRNLYRRIGRELGLTSLEVRIIMLMGLLARPVSISYLAESTYVTKPTILEAIDKLDVKGYVTRERDEEDRRVVLVRLTAKGRELYHKIHERLADLQDFFSKIPVNHLKWTLIFLLEYLKELRDEKVIDVLRSCLTCANFRLIDEERYKCEATHREEDLLNVRIDCPLYQPT